MVVARVLLIMIAAALTGAACSQDDRAFTDGLSTHSWAIGSQPLFDISDTSAAAEPTLLYPRGATILSNGTLVVADQYAHGIRFFDRTGNLVRTVGREGVGPGEFAQIAWLGQCARDSVFVFDRRLNRISVIDQFGTVAREYHPSAATYLLACNQAGRFAAFSLPAGPGLSPTDVDARIVASLWIGDAMGDSLASIGVIPLAENRTLGKVTQFAVADSIVYVGTADSASVAAYDLRGRVLHVFSFEIERRRATEANYDAAIDRAVALFPDPAYRDRVKAMMKRMQPMPEYLPPYMEMVVDPQNLVWLTLSAPGDSVTRLQAFTENGMLRADLTIPGDLVVYEIGNNYILGALQDADGTPHVVAHSLERPPVR